LTGILGRIGEIQEPPNKVKCRSRRDLSVIERRVPVEIAPGIDTEARKNAAFAL
jgi:hypothetical protein